LARLSQDKEYLREMVKGREPEEERGGLKEGILVVSNQAE